MVGKRVTGVRVGRRVAGKLEAKVDNQVLKVIIYHPYQIKPDQN